MLEVLKNNRKRIIWYSILVLFLAFTSFLGKGIYDYIDFHQAADASVGMPWQDGGRITLVREPCILDTPATSPTTCAISCPMVTTAVGTACIKYIELDTVSQKGTLFIASPIEMVYRGGGVHPVAGMQYIAGGTTNALPWVIGIPSAPSAFVQKLVDAYKFVISGFKDSE